MSLLIEKCRRRLPQILTNRSQQRLKSAKNGTERNQTFRTHQRNPTQAKSVHIPTSLTNKHKELQKKIHQRRQGTLRKKKTGTKNFIGINLLTTLRPQKPPTLHVDKTPNLWQQKMEVVDGGRVGNGDWFVQGPKTLH